MCDELRGVDWLVEEYLVHRGFTQTFRLFQREKSDDRTHGELLTHSLTHSHTYTHTHTLPHIHTYIHSLTHIHTCIHTYMHTYIRTYIHAYILTYTRTYMYILTPTHSLTHTLTFTYSLNLALLNSITHMWNSHTHILPPSPTEQYKFDPLTHSLTHSLTGFHAIKIVEQIYHYIETNKIGDFIDLWDFLNKRFFMHLDRENLKLLENLKTDLIKCYLVNLFHHSKKQEMNDFFETYSHEIIGPAYDCSGNRVHELRSW